MTYVTYNPTRVSEANRPGVFLKFKAYLAGRRASREVTGELYSMTDRDLADLGMSRSDFRAIIDETFRKEYEQTLVSLEVTGKA